MPRSNADSPTTTSPRTSTAAGAGESKDLAVVEDAATASACRVAQLLPREDAPGAAAFISAAATLSIPARYPPPAAPPPPPHDARISVKDDPGNAAATSTPVTTPLAPEHCCSDANSAAAAATDPDDRDGVGDDFMTLAADARGVDAMDAAPPLAAR